MAPPSVAAAPRSEADVLLTDLVDARDRQWEAAVAAGPDAMAQLRRDYAESGWTICDHPTCPPFDCRGVKG